MSIVIVSSGAAATPHFRELRSAPLAARAPASAVMQGPAAAGRSADYWTIPATPDLDEGFLYSPAIAGAQSTRTAAQAVDASAWAQFDGVTMDDIARATTASAARLFSYSLW